jgi:hypothetical protein
MLIKLATLGALGYFGYKYYEKNKDQFALRYGGEPEVALAGGPLSDRATLEHSGEPTREWPTIEQRGVG